MKRLLMITTVILAMNISAEAQEATITIKSQSTVSASAITMEDISEISSPDEFLAESIKIVRLGISPMPGNWRELDRGAILDQLMRNGFTSDRIKVICPVTVKIFRSSQVVDQNTLESKIIDYLTANAPWDASEMEIHSISRINEVVLPAGELSIEISSRGQNSFLGQMPLNIRFNVDNQQVHQIVMQATVSVFQNAVVSANAIAPGNSIRENDIEIRRIDISNSRGSAYKELKDVIGMTAKTYIQAGQMISANQITLPTLVKRGETISLIARSQSFIIHTAGLAQQDGKAGDIIRVKNTASNKIVEAKVTGNGTAEVIF